MLVVSRHKGELIIIPTPLGPIRIAVAEIRGEKVRIGIDAPKAIAVHRKEVFDESRLSEVAPETWHPIKVEA